MAGGKSLAGGTPSNGAGGGAGGFAGQRLSEESEIHQQQGNHRQTKGNSGFQVKIDDHIAKVSSGFFHDNNFLNINAANNDIVANKKLIVNNANLNLGFRLGNGVMTIPAINQPAERLTNQSDARANQISTGRNMENSVAISQSVVNQGVLIRMEKEVSAAGGAPSNGAAGGAGGFAGQRLSEESDVQKQTNNQHQGISDSRFDIDIFKIDSADLGIHSNLPRNKIAQSNDIMAKPRFIVNSRSLRAFDPLSEEGTIKRTPSQPAAKLISNSEMTERKVDMFSNAITRNYTSSTLRSGVYPTEKISAAEGGFAGAVNQGWESYQSDSQGEQRHNQVKSGQFTHDDVLPANQSAISQNVKVPVTPYIKPVVQLLSNKAGTNIEPIEISPAPTVISTKALNWSGLNLGFRGIKTNNNSAIERNGNIVSNWLSRLALEVLAAGGEIMPQVYAAEKSSTRIVPLSVYKMLAGQILVKKAMASLPAEDRTAERLAEAVLAAGTPLPEEKRVLQLKKGWNGVGIPRQGTTAVQVMDEIQEMSGKGQSDKVTRGQVAGGEVSDQVARWEFGLWEVVVKRRYSPEHHEIYGRDFPIKDTEGYFIHANEDVKLR